MRDRPGEAMSPQEFLTLVGSALPESRGDLEMNERLDAIGSDKVSRAALWSGWREDWVQEKVTWPTLR